MLIAIQNMTEADALATLTPYSDDNENTTSHMFLDIDDDNTLKGIFFDDSVGGDKVIRALSQDLGGTKLFSVEKILTRAEILDLHNTTINITALEMGLIAGQGALVFNQLTTWIVDPDGTAFAIDVAKLIIIDSPAGEPVANIPEAVIESATLETFQSPTTGIETLADQTEYDIDASGAITLGGANATITVTLFYRKVTLAV